MSTPINSISNGSQAFTPSSKPQEKPKLPELRLDVGSPIGDALRELGYGGQDLFETALQGEVAATNAMQSATRQDEHEQALKNWRTSRTLLNTALGIGPKNRTKLIKGIQTVDANGFPFINRCRQTLINHLHQRGGFPPLTAVKDTLERVQEMLFHGIMLIGNAETNKTGTQIIRSVMKVPGMNVHRIKDIDGSLLLPLAAQKRLYSSVRALATIPGINVNKADSDGITALHWVAESNGNPQIIQALLDAGANPNQVDQTGQTPLHLAAIKGNPYDLQALLDGGADPNRANRNGHTPLHITVANRNSDAILVLLEAKADPNHADLNGQTPLHWAATEGNPDAFRTLLNAGADPKKKDHQGRTPIACANNLEAKRLLKRAAAQSNPSLIQRVKKRLQYLSLLG